MILYHFTAERFVAPIMREGIRLGAVLLRPATYRDVRKSDFDLSYRWLTANPNWSQSWAEGSGRLAYSRTEARFTVDIPDHLAIRWIISGPIISPGAYDLLSEVGDPGNWYLFQGNIPPMAIVAVDYLPVTKYAAP